MITFGKTSSKPNFLFGKLPNYFKENDSYKDGNNEGLLERYLEIFCAEIDDKVSPYIDSVLEIRDAEALNGFPHTDPMQFLNYIASDLGNPPDIGTEEQYIALLRHIRLIFQTKGTITSLKLFLALYGYAVSSLSNIVFVTRKYDETPTPLKYDDSLIYDEELIFYSDCTLIITDYPGTTTGDPGSDWLDLLKEALQKFIFPIFANIVSITYV